VLGDGLQQPVRDRHQIAAALAQRQRQRGRAIR
jgi:hypothetical protein